MKNENLISTDAFFKEQSGLSMNEEITVSPDSLAIGNAMRELKEFFAGEVKCGIKIIGDTVYFLDSKSLDNKIKKTKYSALVEYAKNADVCNNLIENTNNKYYATLSELVLEYLKGSYDTNYDVFDEYINFLKAASSVNYRYHYDGKRDVVIHNIKNENTVKIHYQNQSAFLSLLIYGIFENFPNDYSEEFTLGEYIERSLDKNIKRIINILGRNREDLVPSNELNKEINPVLYSIRWTEYYFKIITYQGKANSKKRRIRFITANATPAAPILQHTIQVNHANVTNEDDITFGKEATQARLEQLSYWNIHVSKLFIPKSNTTKVFTRIEDGLHVSYRDQIKNALIKDTDAFLVDHLYEVTSVTPVRYRGNDNEDTFDTISIRISLISMGLSKDELLEGIIKRKKWIDKAIIDYLADLPLYKKYNVPVSFLKTYDICITQDNCLEYVFQLKNEEKEEAN